MTKEEVINAGIEYTMARNPMCICGDGLYEEMRAFNRNGSFEAGAEWGREKTMDEVCDYLRTHIDPKLVVYNNNTWCSLEEFIERMRRRING